MSVFLTGSDTGVGKTFTAVQLLRLARAGGLRAAGFKPICCGDRHDAELLLAASSDGLTIEQVNPFWLKTPAAPFAASLIEQVALDLGRVHDGLAQLRATVDLVVVEGVGGWLVPISQNYFVSDLAKEMKLPVIVVVRNRLGCLNHAMLTMRNVAASGLECAGLVLNEMEGASDIAAATNADILRRIGEAKLLPMLTEKMAELPAEWLQALGLADAAASA